MEGGGGTILLARSGVPAPERVPDAPLEDAAPTDGGGGITAAFSEVRRDVPAAPVIESDPLTEGGGGTMLAPSEVWRELPEDGLEVEGGGGMTLVASMAVLPLRELPDALAEGGGGMTSCVPKILPITLLIKEGLPA
jgi:hypothetical protein